jgi:hypothetical protein
MDGGHLPGQQPLLQAHQGGNRQPAFDAGRTLDGHCPAPAFEIPHEQIELDADPDMQQQKAGLNRATKLLRAVGRRSPPGLVPDRLALGSLFAFQDGALPIPHGYKANWPASGRL